MVEAEDRTRGRERLAGIVDRLTYVNPNNGWSVIKVTPFGEPARRVTVTMHQVAIVAGASAEFWGHWTVHPKFGEQFEAEHVVEKKPASAAALERYLGSGLIRGVGPATARKIVRHFGDETLEVFDGEIERLTQVKGIAQRKLESIAASWSEHRAIRDVMMFLQEHQVSTLFAVRIYKRYGDDAIAVVRDDPYRLARDIFGIGFFSADRIALSMGFARDGEPRIEAAVRHVLAASREAGHCFLFAPQVREGVVRLLEPEDPARMQIVVDGILQRLAAAGDVAARPLASPAEDGAEAEDEAASEDRVAYYARSLFRDEEALARTIARRSRTRFEVDAARVERWLDAYAERASLVLSHEQRSAVAGMVAARFSVLTGGPGCGKTTTLRTLVALLRAIGHRVLLCAPTGRAAQRMTEVVGEDARTIHRLLEWDPIKNGFRRDEDSPLQADFVVVDEASMLDVSLAAALCAAVPERAGLVLIGDPDQLPSVGPGDVLADLLESEHVTRFSLTQIFRQAADSKIVEYAHAMRRGEVPSPPSPLADRSVWGRGEDCLFLDAEEATLEQLDFVRRARIVIERVRTDEHARTLVSEGEVVGRLGLDAGGEIRVATTAAPPPVDDDAGDTAADAGPIFTVPRKFLHVDLERFAHQPQGLEEIRAVMRRVHPHSTLRHGLSLTQALLGLYTKRVPQQLGRGVEIQVLCPMNRGSVGADALNRAIQAAVNPAESTRGQIVLGQRVFRTGDRVIQRRNNYDVGVFNGDIGRIVHVDAVEMRVRVAFGVGNDEREVELTRDALSDLSLAYAITVHKSQGSEFPVVIMPLVPQHHTMLFRDLVYTGLTRARRLAVFIGGRGALARAVTNVSTRARQTALTQVLDEFAAKPSAGAIRSRG